MKNLLIHYDSARNMEELVDSALNYCSVFQDSTTITFAYIKEKLDDDKTLLAKLQEIIDTKKTAHGPTFTFIKKEGKPSISTGTISMGSKRASRASQNCWLAHSYSPKFQGRVPVPEADLFLKNLCTRAHELQVFLPRRDDPAHIQFSPE